MSIDAGLGSAGEAETVEQPASTSPHLAITFPANAAAASILVSGLIVLAAVLRLARLDWLPLDAIESVSSLAAAGKVAPNIAPNTSPLLVSLQTFAFWLLGPSVSSARLVSALAGVTLVALAAATAKRMGTGTALAAAGLFSLAPLWVFYGRHISPEGLAGAVVMGVLAAGLSSAPTRRWAIPVATGLLVAAGPPVMTFLVAALACMAATRGSTRWLRGWADESWTSTGERTTALFVFALTGVLASTAFLHRPEGFAEVIATPAAWLGRFAAIGEGWSGTLLALLTYAPGAAVFGLAGLAIGIRRGSAAAGCIAVWAGVAFFVVMVAGEPLWLAELLLPLTLAASVAVAVLLDSLANRFKWSEEGATAMIVVLVAGFVAVQAAAFSNEAPDQSGRFFLVIGGLAMIALLGVLYAALWSPGLALRALGLAALIVLPVLAWANGTALSYSDALQQREPIRPTYSTPDLSRLVDNLEAASWNRTADPHELSVRADPSLAPILAWPLRDRRVTWGAASGEVSDEIVVRPHLDAEDGGFGPDPYVGGTYRPTATWVRSFPGAAGNTSDPRAGARAFARWYIQRRSPSAPDADIAYDQVDVFLKAEE